MSISSDDDNVLFVKYEDMKRDLPHTVRQVSEFLGYPLSPAVVDKISKQTSFENMKENPLANYHWDNQRREGAEPFLRKGAIGDWKTHFSEEQSARLEAEYTKKMAGSGLDFTYE